MAAPQIIVDLVKRFDDGIEEFKSNSYNETELRSEFLVQHNTSLESMR
ncbi:MAG: hypothetical protein A4E45_00067 [Methanosaeta sp. PtaB.Bin039]|nr:MAG: hypothetical protein A4E45_00067 [Methanosaeta sp. PtaB.Bin039]